MTDTKYLDEAARLAGLHDWGYAQRWAHTLVYDSIRAHAATLEREAKFRQEVSEAAQSMETAMRTGTWQGVALDRLKQFILPTPNPIKTALSELGIDPNELARRGVKLVECE